MSETQTEIVDEVVETTAPSEAERIALDQGWMPLEKWTAAGNSAADHRSAREFNDRGELLRRLSEANKHNQSNRQSIEQLRVHNQKVYESAYKKAIADLREEHAKAVNDGDLKKAEKVVDQITETRDNFVQAAIVNQSAAQPATVPQEFVDWQIRNDWYAKDEDMRVFADAIGFKFAQSRQGRVSPSEVLAHIDEKMKAKFMKEPVVPQKVAAPDPVAGTERKAQAAPQSKGPTIRKADLSDDELKAMKDFVGWKLGTETDYLKQLAETR